MKILNFIPLLIWILGFLFWGSWEQHLQRIDGIKEDESQHGATAKFFVWIGEVWLVIGIFLSV